MNGMAICAGVDGIGLGLGIAVPSYRTVCAIEREAPAAAILVARQEDASLHPFPIWDCVTTFDGKPWRGIVDVLHAGIPCQPWSVAGKQLGTEDERWIWPDVLRIIREVEPPIVFLEEVRGFIRGGLGLVVRDLADLGYVGHHDIFSAAEVGAPHRRERLFTLAVRWDLLAHAPLRGLGVRGEPSGRGGLADGGDGLVADPGDGLIPQPRRGSQGRDGVGSAGEVAVAGAEREGLEERGRVRGEQLRQDAESVDAGLPIFPPGPSDAAAWRRLLEAHPHLAPALESGVCGDVDGVAVVVDQSRADSLRAIGNGVVAVQGAAAFIELSRRAGIDWGGQMSNQWVTPRTITGGGESAERKQELGRTASGGGDLQAQAALWTTPQAHDSGGATR